MTDRYQHRILTWLSEDCLPFWAKQGLDGDYGFVERLHLDGTPDYAARKRVRVQARQIYVFSHAQILGLMPNGGDIAARGFDFLLNHACPGGPHNGFARALARDGSVLDPTRDTYDHAFLLYAFSWLFVATGRGDVRKAMTGLLETINGRLRHSCGLGFYNDDLRKGERHQNPHMHMFEAALAAYRATDDLTYLALAEEMFTLFRSFLYDPEIHALREYFTDDWQPVPGARGQVVEPGHHCEWIWLLGGYADATGQPLCHEAFGLFDFALRHGFAPQTGLAFDEIRTDGTVKISSHRSWPQLESIQAEIAISAATDMPISARVDLAIENLFSYYLDKPLKGCWMDWIDENHRPIAQFIPASTLYHIVIAFSEYLRACDQRKLSFSA